jgi:hypothetical protein
MFTGEHISLFLKYLDAHVRQLVGILPLPNILYYNLKPKCLYLNFLTCLAGNVTL